MAASYTVNGSWNTTELKGGNVVTPVQEFGIITKPSGIYFQFRRPVSQLSKLPTAARSALIADVADQLADRIEAVMKNDNVLDIAYSQPTNAAGQLLDCMTIYVQSDSGNSQGTVVVPLANLGPGAFTSSRIASEVEALNHAEDL